ncbi:hypothetical protein TNCV_4666781 [Trichonephila clavipes]|nr:hypothetical protein TNCV_4666781 [Trichonephila clavipes]
MTSNADKRVECVHRVPRQQWRNVHPCIVDVRKISGGQSRKTITNDDCPECEKEPKPDSRLHCDCIRQPDDRCFGLL